MERTRIILIRHGQTTINLEKKLSGHTDPPLTELGLTQARAASDMLSRQNIDRIFSSPLSRAADTAALLAKGRGIEPELHEGLMEQNFGQWEGKSFVEIFKLIPGGPEKLLRGPFLARFPEGEGTEGFVARVIKAFHDVVMKGSEGKTIAIATHLGVIVVLLSHFLGVDPLTHFYRIRVNNGSVSMVDHYEQGLYHIQYINRVPDTKS